MFERGAIDEVRAAGSDECDCVADDRVARNPGTARWKKITQSQCIEEIQQATRRYAKRQLTWFRRQTNFVPLNLSFLTHKEAAKWISLRILSEAGTRDD